MIEIAQSESVRIIAVLDEGSYAAFTRGFDSQWPGVPWNTSIVDDTRIRADVDDQTRLLQEELVVGLVANPGYTAAHCLVGQLDDGQTPPIGVIVNRAAWVDPKVRAAISCLTGARQRTEPDDPPLGIA